MAQRTDKYRTITAGGTPQPMFGTTLSAATTVSATQVNVAVVDSSAFRVGDWALFDVGASEERQSVTNIPDATHIKVNQLEKAHASGTYVRVSVQANSVYVQELDGNAGNLFIGNSNAMVTGTGAKVIAKLVKVASGVQPGDFSSATSGLGNIVDTAEYWIDGSTGDSFLPSFATI